MGRRAVPDSPPRVLESHWFVWITQMNHIPKEIGHEKHRDWASSQVGGRGAGPISPGVGEGRPDGAAVGPGLRASPPHLCPAHSWQLAATCNVEPSLFIDWFSGHLNFQIEHQ